MYLIPVEINIKMKGGIKEMMMQNVVTQTKGIMSIARDYSTRTKRTKGNDFDLFLDNCETVSKAKTSIKGVDKSKDKSTDINVSKDKALSESRESKDTQIKKNEISHNAKTKKNLKEVKDSAKDVNTTLVEQIQNMLDQIKGVIMEELDLTSEELESIMTELGISPADLTDPQALMQLLLSENGASSATEILLDEQLGNTFQGLLESTKNIKEELLPELADKDIKQILEQSAMQSDSVDDSLAESNLGEQTLVLVDADTSKDVNKSKHQVETWQVTLEASDKDGEHLGLGAVDNSDMANFNENDSSDSKSSDSKAYEADIFDTIIDNLSTNYEKPIVEFTDDNIKLYDISDIAQQIIEKVRVMVKPGQATMELRLYPEHLGKLNVTLSSKEGLISARFVVENEMAKEAVESQLIILKENLAEQGIKVDTIDVTVGSYTFDQNKQSDEDNHRTKKKADTGRKITFEEAVAMSEEPDDMDSSGIIDTLGYSVNYKA